MQGWLIAIISILAFIALVLICIALFHYYGTKLIPIILLLLTLVLIIFLYVLLFNVAEPKLDQSLFIDPDMQIFDYIWYALIVILIVFLSAALIHSITISGGLLTYFMLISVGISMILIIYSIFYKIYKNREKLGKIVFIMTIYAILLTFLMLFLNKFVPAHILRIIYVLYSLFIFAYICSFFVLIATFIYNLIVYPAKIQNMISNFNVFGKLNAGAFNILSL